jgi:hypothetical protein
METISRIIEESVSGGLLAALVIEQKIKRKFKK